MVATFTLFNVLMLIINLIPSKSPGGLASDGHILFKLWTTNGREILASEDVTVVFPPDTSLLSVDGFMPEGFATGLEILNDRTTPMDFVIAVLTKNLEQEREQAVKTMLAIHRTGGLLLALPSYERAEAIAQAITNEARERGHPLVCRAVRRQQNDVQPAVPGERQQPPSAPVAAP
jgi:ATP-dependent Clp protease adaptor protein ClpS